jgi:glycine/D-amino acid oxidase-like deaminating enzyme
MTGPRSRIAIIGGHFAGLSAAIELSRRGAGHRPWRKFEWLFRGAGRARW